MRELWRKYAFTDVFDIQGGSQPPKSKFIYKPCDGYIRLLQIRDFGEKPLPTYIPITKTLKTCEIDDILIARYGASIGRICTGMSGAYNVAMAKVIVPENVYKKFALYLLKSYIFQSEILRIERSAQDGFNKDDLSKITVPLPPTIEEQQQIVERLEARLGKLNTARQRLEKIPRILKRFRQSVLASACSGKITAGWREGKNLPEWEETTLGKQQVAFKYGTSEKSEKAFTGTPVVRIPNIGNLVLDLDDLKYLQQLESSADMLLKNGDILIIRSNGSRDLVGKTALVEKVNEKYTYASYLIRIRQTSMNSKFLLFVLNSPSTREQFFAKAKSSAGINNINTKELSAVRFAFPSLPEQEEIVRRVDKFFAIADSIEQRYRDVSTKLAKAEKALYAKAFRGEL